MDKNQVLADEMRYLDSIGIAVIPVGEKHHTRRDGTSAYKAAFIPYAKERFKKRSFLELWDLILQFNTNAVACLLGERSGGLICLDIDVKYKAGFDAILFSDLRSLYPSLLAKMRIEKTPNNGYHLLYFLENGEHETCERAARRLATPDELIEKPKESSKCFIEIKGGNLSQTYPSPGYGLVQREVGTLTWEEHQSVVFLCRSYDEVVDEVKLPVVVKRQYNDWYSTNPFEDFNGGMESDSVLTDAGWKIISSNGKITNFGKPDSKNPKEVHASFFERGEKSIYKIYTTTTGLEPKSYTPAILLGALEFNDDRKLLNAHLVSKGYGILKPQIEQKVLDTCIRKGVALPANVSLSGQEAYKEGVEKMKLDYPYGIFWESMKEGGIKINRHAMYRVAHSMGFRKYQNRPVFIEDGKYIETLESESEFIKRLRRYIVLEEDDDVFNAFDAHMQTSTKFKITMLEKLEEDQLLRSDSKVSYKFFSNCYIRITFDSIEEISYDDLHSLIFKNAKQNREWVPADFKTGIYYDFLDKAIGFSDYVAQCIGYYAHEFRDENGYMVVAGEACDNPKGGAGAGKNIFWDLMKLTTSYKTTAASMIKYDNSFMQSWNGEKVFHLSDIAPDFKYIFFKDIITGSAVVRKLYIDEYTISVSDMCKLSGSTNYSYDDSDPGVARRVRLLEFTDYFTKLGTGAVSKKYGKHFPKDWESVDYVGFDNCMVYCIQKFLENECNINRQPLTSGGWIKQFNQKYKHLYLFIDEHIGEWVSRGKVSNNDYRKCYDDYVRENSIKHFVSSFVHNQALADYCKHFNIEFEFSVIMNVGPVSVRGRVFGKKEEIKQHFSQEQIEATPF